MNLHTNLDLTGENKYVGWKRHTKQMKCGYLVGFKKSDIEKA